MKDLSLWFCFTHYTECFVFLKKCFSHKVDKNLDMNDIMVLQNLDNILRETSHTSGLITNLFTIAAVTLFVSLNSKSEIYRPRIILKGLFGLAILWNVRKFGDAGSHLSLMFSMPYAFNVLHYGVSQDSLIRKYLAEFCDEFSLDLQDKELEKTES